MSSQPDAAERLEEPQDPGGSSRLGLGEEAYLRLRTSRTPVREALVRLARDGLVQLTPGRGARVTDISLADVRDLFQLREALEGLAARLAAANAAAYAAEVDLLIQRFHEYEDTGGHPPPEDYYVLTSALDDSLATMAGNRRLEQALRDVWAHSRRLRQYASHDAARVRSSAREHVGILEAVRDGDGDRAEAAVRLHLGNSRRAILDKFLGS